MVRPFWRNTSTAVLTLAVTGAATLGLVTPALAAAGDASARGVVTDLDAEVLGVPVISANGTIGTATAPVGFGTDSETAVPIVVPGAVGVVFGGTVDVSATRAPGISLATSTIQGLSIGLLGISAISADEISADVTCPALGTQTADTVVNNLEVFGTPVVLVANAPATTRSAPSPSPASSTRRSTSR